MGMTGVPVKCILLLPLLTRSLYGSAPSSTPLLPSQCGTVHLCRREVVSGPEPKGRRCGQHPVDSTNRPLRHLHQHHEDVPAHRAGLRAPPRADPGGPAAPAGAPPAQSRAPRLWGAVHRHTAQPRLGQAGDAEQVWGWVTPLCRSRALRVIFALSPIHACVRVSPFPALDMRLCSL